MTARSDWRKSGIYQGTTYHQRFIPRSHQFDYSLFLLWINLDDLPQATLENRWFSALGKPRVLSFNVNDYLTKVRSRWVKPVTLANMKERVLDRANELHGQDDLFHPCSHSVCFLGQPRCLGWYFSPVNFYYIFKNDDCTHVLAEVSNTPWNKRHHYLIDFSSQQDTAKAFHVSPFNPMDMTYRWNLSAPAQRLKLEIHCHREQLEFSAGLNLQKKVYTELNMRAALARIPSMTLHTVVGIYWQALKLFLKKVPLYGYPK